MTTTNIKDITVNKMATMLEVKYLSPTNTKGARAKVTNTRTNTSIIIPWNYSFNNIVELTLNELLVVRQMKMDILSISCDNRKSNSVFYISVRED